MESNPNPNPKLLFLFLLLLLLTTLQFIAFLSLTLASGAVASGCGLIDGELREPILGCGFKDFLSCIIASAYLLFETTACS